MSFCVKKTGGRMWHEARKQEKKIRGMLVDYRRRAERKSDPTQFLQLHGRPCKIHLDPAIATAGDSPANMMPWQGNEDNLIDRFDVRAHLDWIPEAPESIDVDIALTSEDRHINYERYRIIVQNEFLGVFNVVTEEKFLHQIHLEEQFGSSTKLDSARDKKKSYICVDVSQIEPSQAHEMNLVAQKYGLLGADYFSFLTQDFEEAETLRQARKQEEEKAMYSGRRSRRERRAFREKKMIGRVMSPPSYAARESPEYNPYRKSSSKSRSRSISPVNTGQITYITSFDVEGRTAQHLMNGQLIENFQNPDLGVALDLSINPNHTETMIENVVHPGPNQEELVRDIEKSQGQEQEVVQGDHELEVNLDLDIEVLLDLVHVLFQGQKQDLDLDHVQKDLEVHLRVVYPDQNRHRDQDLSHITEVIQEIVIVENIILRRNQYLNLDRELNLNLDLDQDQEANPDANDLVVPKIKYQHCQGAIYIYFNKCEIFNVFILFLNCDIRYYGRRGKSSSLELELSDNEEKVSQATPKPTVTNTTNMNKPKAGLSTNSGGGHKVNKADKKAEQLRLEKMEQQRQDREDEIREMSLKLRRKQRERRHRYEGHSSDSHSSVSRTPSPGRSPRIVRRERKDRDIRDFENDRERERDRERDRRDDREKFRSESRRRYRDSPLRSLSPRNSR
ncbi:CLK4-associating serine/arginine rich protein [Melipona quadrifasciata]|uniref:CLK4-associating serine/arginine rich protein n=1 Tax=Melipona quadrifasciata TaxID=166423 RepID=A0A0M9ADH7_9HYME|nr:CLK4-associating serine/arginine rich protein [Melipona quadrifasciata]